MALNPLSIFSGPSPLPPQVGQVTNVNAPTQFQQGQADIAQGSALTAGGTSALAMAEKGQLTPEQQASLDVYTKNLQNTAMQEYSSLGIAPNKSTSFISTEEDIATKTMAAAQAFIQSTIALGGTMLSTGASFMGLGQQAEDAATKDLLATAQMQISQDQAYSKLIGDTLGSIAKIFSGGAIGAGLTSFLGGGGSSGGGGASGTYEGNINTPANPSF